MSATKLADSARPPAPNKLTSSKSFSRYEAHRVLTPSRSRASTLSNEVALPARDVKEDMIDDPLDANQVDVFARRDSDALTSASKPVGGVQSPQLDAFPVGFDELPVELVSLTDRFISSLTSAKIYTTPPSIDRLSDLFQDFYVQAESHISTHIQALSSRQYRESSPAPSVSSRTSRLSSRASRDTLNLSEKVIPGQQMLTAGEISERRKARKMLDQKRIALEEAVERRICESIYGRIWRHRSTLDEVRDEKLRSRTASLSLVGIGLKELGIDLESAKDKGLPEKERVALIDEWIGKARQALLEMDQSHNPLGKLQRLAAAHQIIVDLLSNLHQSSSSADEILPTLIYTLITSPAEGINIISNLNFIQRFRSASKINGEAAYCLTNLEAAITFLETVDLATLRADENLEGPKKSTSHASLAAQALAPIDVKAASAGSPSRGTPVTAVSHRESFTSASRPPLSPSANFRPPTPQSPSQPKRLSALFQPPVDAIGAASDAVLSTADQGFRNIGSSLDNSFKLLFGRLKEQHVQGPGTDAHGGIIVPKTLDEARRLVAPKPMVDEDGNVSENSSVADAEADYSTTVPNKGDRLLEMITGTRQQPPGPRDRSVDSIGSSASDSRRVAVTSDPRSLAPPVPATSPGGGTTLGASPPLSGAVESMRNLGNSLNPLNRFAGINVMRGFGRTTSSPAATTTTSSSLAITVDQAAGKELPDTPTNASINNHLTGTTGTTTTSTTTARDSLLASAATAATATAGVKMAPPVPRFLELADARDLRLGDVEALLADYQRLVEACRGRGLFS